MAVSFQFPMRSKLLPLKGAGLSNFLYRSNFWVRGKPLPSKGGGAFWLPVSFQCLREVNPSFPGGWGLLTSCIVPFLNYGAKNVYNPWEYVSAPPPQRGGAYWLPVLFQFLYRSNSYIVPILTCIVPIPVSFKFLYRSNSCIVPILICIVPISC